MDRHAAAGGDDAFGDLVTARSGDVAVENGDVVGVDPQQLQSGIAVAGDVRLTAIPPALGYQFKASSRASASSTAAPIDLPRREDGALGEADGAVSGGTTAFDDEVPAVANLDAALLGALRRATTDAADDGVAVYVDSGWRSAAYQERLLQEAVSEYGSEEEAARWVATPTRSAHVSGDAVDIAPLAARAWLSKRGATYGLCHIYRNEPWHFELRPKAIDRGCPSMYGNPMHDPRMQP